MRKVGPVVDVRPYETTLLFRRGIPRRVARERGILVVVVVTPFREVVCKL